MSREEHVLDNEDTGSTNGKVSWHTAGSIASPREGVWAVSRGRYEQSPFQVLPGLCSYNQLRSSMRANIN